MKTCPYCKTERALTEFAPGRHKCKACVGATKVARSRAWYAANRERKAATDAAWREANKEHVDARSAAYRAANKEKIAAREAARHAANKESISARKAAWREANKEKIAAHRAAYYAANKESISARKAAWYAANKERISARKAAYREANKEKEAVYKAAYREANLEKIREAKVRRLRTVKGQTPQWADRQAMLAIYRDAREFRAAGLDVHVDHIVPLRGELVSGLHCEFNLTVKMAFHNDSKGTKFDPLTFEHRWPQG